MRDLKRSNPLSDEDRPKSHSPSSGGMKDSMTNYDRKKLSDSTDRKSSTDRKKMDSTSSVDRKSPPDGSCSKNTSWSSADSVQHFPERDTSGQVRSTPSVVVATEIFPTVFVDVDLTLTVVKEVRRLFLGHL